MTIQILKYLILFSILILVFLWTFQVLFLNKYYEYEKTKDIKDVASMITRNIDKNNITKIIDNAAVEKDVCVEITSSTKNIYSSSFVSKGCFTGAETKTKYKTDFIYSNNKTTTYELINPRFNNKTLVYAIKLNNDLYAFVNTSLDPIDSTVDILKNQLIIVTIIVLLLSGGVAYFISKRLSNPIVKITKQAKRLGNGDFNVVFDDTTAIDELNELSATLNYTRDELAKTEEYRRDLMANVSHDLKTPLTMIKAYAEMARDLNTNKKVKRNSNLNVIIEETDRLTVLVNDILELSKMQSNLDSLRKEVFDLNKLVNDILNRYEIYKELEDYKFIYNYDKELMINADKQKLEQVIYNLINNAINYTGKDKTVEIKIINKNDYYKIEIIDTGKGIRKEDIKYIWDRYYKNKKKHRRNLIGTGLGLSIVKSVLELHNYNYGVISKKDIGTTFYFEIPKE